MPIPLFIPGAAILGFCVAPFLANYLGNIVDTRTEMNLKPAGLPYHPLAENHAPPEYIEDSRVEHDRYM